MNDYLKCTCLEIPKEIPFPFTPYDIQIKFMTKLYEVIENKQLGIFESPTGTGKSLSVICGALCWLRDHEIRNKNDIQLSIAKIEEEISKMSDFSDDWMSLYTKQAGINRAKDELRLQLKAIEDLEELIENINAKISEEKENASSKSRKTFSFSQPMETETLIESEDNDIILEHNEEKDVLSDENEDAFEYECTKIYFCSRTHSQLSQFIGEVKRSPFSDTRVVPLASRQTLCINPNVQKLKSITLINERCLEMQKNKRATNKVASEDTRKRKKCASSSCPYNNKTSIDKLSDELIVKVLDVEELVLKGKELNACPYYAARSAVPLSQLVVVPYNTILHKNTRLASKIKLKDSVVIIDEAHNLLDAIGNMHSSQITGSQLCQCHCQLSQYKEKYEKRFSAYNLLHLNQLIYILGQLISTLGGKGGCNPIECSRKGIDTKVYTLSEFVHVAEIDNYNLYKLLDFCQKSKITHKLQGFIEKYRPAVGLNPKPAESGLKAFLKSISDSKNKPCGSGQTNVDSKTINSPNLEAVGNPILIALSFIESLTNHCDDGRIVCSRQATVGRGSLKFLLLNPAAHFQDIVQEARSVIVAGGTMQPISEFQKQLFENAGAERSRVVAFSCGHVIDPGNILPIVLSSGPTGKLLDFSYQTRNSLAMMNEIGRILNNVCNVVPAGVVCFFPSYEYEQAVHQHLETHGMLQMLSKKKRLFREPKKSSDTDAVLNEFAKHIKASKENNVKPNGCLLFSVIGGKLSEGLNFSDDLGRCVIVVGLPYPNIKSPELQEKIKYLDQTMGKGTGQAHYENLCMKAVNQSIGRAVRHKDDYAAVLLLDHRYTRNNIQDALPQWMKSSLINCDKFGIAFSSLTKFFKSKV